MTRSHPTITYCDGRRPMQGTLRCGDGRWLMLVMPQPDPYWPRVCAALGLDALVDDPRFNSLNARAEHNRQLVAILEETFERLTIAEAGERLDGHGVIWAPVQQLTEVVDDPQARVNGYFATVEHPTLGRFEMVDAPFRFQRSHVGVRGPAPEVGQHTEEVLIEQGYTWEEIVELRERGAL
ncbi:MAG: CoA transferase [Dehalococcoidia bacterium]